MGLSYQPDWLGVVGGAMAVGVFAMLIDPRQSARTFLLHIMILIYLSPATALNFLAGYSLWQLGLIWISAALVSIFSLVRVPLIRVPAIKANHILYILCALSVVLSLVIVLFGGLTYFNLDLNEVYNVRSAAADQLPGIFGYIIPAFTKAIIPMGIALALYFRSLIFTAVFFAISVFMFGATSHKIMLFSPFLIFGIYQLFVLFRGPAPVIAGLTATLAVIFLAIEQFSYGPVGSILNWIESMIVWRSLIVPAYLDFTYLEYFSKSEFYYWSTSNLTLGLIREPYDGLSPANLIGVDVFGSDAVEANTGFVGSGFAQAGAIGTLLYAAGVGLMVSFVGAAARRLGAPLVVSATFMLFITMISSTDFVGLFLTHGLLIMMLLLSAISLPERKASAEHADELEVAG